jgi:CheY-like chemotaxis protein
MEGAQRCADLTHRLLAFSRRQPLQATIISVSATMPGLLELMRRTLGENIGIELKTEEDIWPVRVDQAQFEAALLNLAVNARDAMPDGGDLTIQVENRVIETTERPGSYVVISVKDTGTGMPAHVLERVFEPFFTTKESGKGTGLGLSMVYGFAQQSGGYVEIDSAPNQGTTIDGEVTQQDNQARHTDMLPFGEGTAVLVVEDEPSVRQVAVSTLKALGFTVTEAKNADEAADILKTNQEFRLVLSDIRMPGQRSGIDLAVFIKQQYPGIPILLTTGYSEDSAHADAFQLLYKPYRAADLAQRIQAVLSHAEPAPDKAGLPIKAVSRL